MAKRVNRFDTGVPATSWVTITDASGNTRTMTVEEFRRERGLVECQKCFRWDTKENIAKSLRRGRPTINCHYCKYVSDFGPRFYASGVDAHFSTKPMRQARD